MAKKVTTHAVCTAVFVNGHPVGKVQRQSSKRWCANSLPGAECYGGFRSLHKTKAAAVDAVVDGALSRMSDELKRLIGL